MPASILIMDDNVTNRDLMRYLLDKHGYRTRLAVNGAEGLEMIKTERPDLVICDRQMPVLDGFAVAKAMKSNASLKSIPLVSVTAAAMVGDKDKALAAGFDGYISKPIEPETFVQQIEAFLPEQLRARGTEPGGR